MLLFLGSGASFKSGLPSVEKLTNLVRGKLEAEWITARFKIEPGQSLPFLEASTRARVQALLDLLFAIDEENRKSIACYWAGKEFRRSGSIYRKFTTYEDLFYLCEQIRWNGEALIDEAPVGAFVNLVESRAGSILPSDCQEARLVSLYALARAASQLIEFAVERSLRCNSPLGLGAAMDLAERTKLDVVTLNHDTLLEQAFRMRGIHFSDGFGQQDGDVRWAETSLLHNRNRVRIFKPHGSIDWRQFLVGGKVATAQAEPRPNQVWKSSSGQELQPFSTVPSFLTGGNKVLSYNSGLYAEMIHGFHNALLENTTVVMCGYGWGDAGINLRLESWLDQCVDRRLVLLHNDHPEKLFDRSVQLDRSYPGWLSERKLHLVGKWLSELTGDEILQEVDKSLR